MTRCSRPRSPIARRAAVSRLVRVASLTKRPDHRLLEQFLLGYDPVAVLEKIGQDIEHLRLDLDELAGIAELIAL